MALIITLVILGLLLLLAEIVIIPGIGISGILGVLSLVAAVYYSYVVYDIIGGVIAIIAVALLGTVMIIYALRSKTWKKLTLRTEIKSRTDELPEEKGIFVGAAGKTLTRIAPMGKALIAGKEVEVSSLGKIIDSDVRIKVVSLEGRKIYVEELQDDVPEQ